MIVFIERVALTEKAFEKTCISIMVWVKVLKIVEQLNKAVTTKKYKALIRGKLFGFT